MRKSLTRVFWTLVVLIGFIMSGCGIESILPHHRLANLAEPADIVGGQAIVESIEIKSRKREDSARRYYWCVVLAAYQYGEKSYIAKNRQGNFSSSSKARAHCENYYPVGRELPIYFVEQHPEVYRFERSAFGRGKAYVLMMILFIPGGLCVSGIGIRKAYQSY